MARSQSRAQRKTVFIKAHLKAGEHWRDITIGNVSASGLMVKSRVAPQVGSYAEVRRRGIVIIGEVVWSMSTRFGLRSLEPIDVEALTAESGLSTNQTRSQEPVRRGLWHWRKK
jgi:hypothetical protein